MNQKEELKKKRIIDLASKSFRNNMFIFTNFLSESELSDFYQMQDKLNGSTYQIFGGYELAERAIIRFGSIEDLGFEEKFPIVCIKVEPLIEKFADLFSHRDFLGAVMNLGIERDQIGDIVIEGKSAYIFTIEKMGNFICQNLDQVKHTHVKCTIVKEILTSNGIQTKLEEVSVSSERVDAVIARIYHISRNESINLFRTQKVFVNGKTMENNSYFLREEDKVSVRGFGKFIYKKVIYTSKKGKLSIQIERFI
jgi:RNA-binding protein YlmH